MRFPFEDDDATDGSMRRFPRILAICLSCALILGLIGFGSWLLHRHQVVAVPPSTAAEGARMGPSPQQQGEPAAEAASLTDDEKQYVREARMLRDSKIESRIKDFGYSPPYPSGSKEYNDELKNRREVAEQLLSGQADCWPEFWGGQPLFDGMVAKLRGEYRIEQIVGANEMICRLYGPVRPDEWWSLVPLGENAVWLSGVPTKGHIDGEHVSFDGLLAVHGTQRHHVRDDVYATYYHVEPTTVDSVRVNVTLRAAKEADEQDPVKSERLKSLRKLAGLAPVKADATNEADVQAQQQPTQQTEKRASGFWLSRSAIKSDERVVFSLAQPSERADGDGSIRFDQNFSRASIGRKLEAGEQVFVHGFTAEFLPPDSGQGTDSKSRGRGLWFIRDANGQCKLGYDREKLSATAKRRGEPVRRWLPIEDNSVRTIVGRNLTRGERAFLHDPKVDTGK
jgi:hypothetical protein